MGLDITAYSRLQHVGHHEFDPALNDGEPGPRCYYDNHVQAYAYDCFPASFRGIPILGRKAQHPDIVDGGCYETTDKTETIDFQAGSYSGYNAWRADLARQFNPAPRVGRGRREPDPDLPFYELIWFADNEGTIGPEAAYCLLDDFRTHADAYAPDEPMPGYWREKYTAWTRAFELAADGGLVRFH